MTRDIVFKSIRMIRNNLRAAFQIALLPIIASIICNQIAETSSSNIITLIATLISWALNAWVAVAWHRFILLEDYPTGYVPSLNTSEIFGYMWRNIALISLALILLFPAYLIIAFAPSFGLMALIPIGALIVTPVFLRLGLILPAAAISKPIGFKDAWENGQKISYLSLLLIFPFLMLLSLIIMVPLTIITLILSTLLSSASPFMLMTFMAILFTPLEILVVLVGVSLLTTLYGVCVENRALR